MDHFSYSPFLKDLLYVVTNIHVLNLELEFITDIIIFSIYTLCHDALVIPNLYFLISYKLFRANTVKQLVLFYFFHSYVCVAGVLQHPERFNTIEVV